MVRLEIQSTYGDKANDLGQSNIKNTSSVRRASFKSDLDSSRLGLFILRCKATLLHGSCAVKQIPVSSTSAGGMNIWFEVPYNAMHVSSEGDDHMEDSRKVASSSNLNVNIGWLHRRWQKKARQASGTGIS